jgi:tetratricopeptide (TPR) repeat protein
VSEISAQAGEEEATREMGKRDSIGRAVTFFEEGNGKATDRTNTKNRELGGTGDSMRSILTDQSEDCEIGSSSASGLLSRSTGLSSTRSLDLDSLTSGVGGSTITSGRTGRGSEDTKKASNTATAKEARATNRGVPSQIGDRRRPERQTQASGEQATEAPRYRGARGGVEEEVEYPPQGSSLFEVAWKYNSMPCIYLGGVHSIETASSQDGGKSSASRMHEGMVLSARQRFNYRSTMFDLGQDDDYDEVDGSGCLVMEGPPPQSGSIGSEEQQQLWWTVRVPVWRLGAADDESVDSSILPQIEIVSVDDMRKGHSIVASFLKNGQFAEAIHFLYNSIIVALRSTPEIQQEWSATVGGDLINMSLRNIGTVELWMGRLEESSHSLYHVVNREEGEPTEDVDPISRRLKPFRVASSLVLLGLSLYSLEDFEEANNALIKSLSVIDGVINGGNYAETSSGSIDSFDDDCIFTAGKVLNNIGAAFFELGFSRSASRALHRSLLVFLSKDLECGCPPLSLDDSLEGYNPPFPSLTDLMNGLKLKSIRASNLPIEHRFDAAITFSNLGSLLVKRGKFSAASVCLNTAEPILSKTVEDHNPVCYSTMEGQAYLNIKMHRYERALRIYEKMLEIEERRGTSSTVHHLTIAKLLGKMSFAYLKMHKNRAALACLKGVLANQEAVLPPDDPSITQTRNFMSDIKARLRKERENKEKA